MEYCGHCGEAVEGRFCRMCGTPVGGGATAAVPLAAAPGGYGAAAGPVPAAEATMAFAGPVPAATEGFGPEPTRALTATPAEFDGLFRTEDGTPGMHGQTQVLPPVVGGDYRMPPPAAGPGRPGAGAPADPGYPEPDAHERRTNRPMVFALVGAVVVAAALIIGLLYLGSRNTGGPAAATGPTSGASQAAGATQSGGQINIPTDGATLAPTSAAPSATAGTADTSQAFHGDALPLGPGSSGSMVKWVQERLHQLGYYHDSATGSFDQATALAVQQFQAAAGVTGDPASTVGQHTLVALEAAGSTPNLRMGSRSPDVGRLNTALATATGARLSGNRYTSETAAAVMRYQSAVGLAPTGQVDAATWAKLQDGTLATG